MSPATQTVPAATGTCYNIARLTGLALALALAAALSALSACTTEDPLFCEKDEDCASDHYCDEPIHTCRPKATDAAPDGPATDGAPGAEAGQDGGLDSGADAADAAPLDGPDAALPDAGDDLPPPDTTPPDTLPPDTKFANGAACTSAAQCASGFCADKVCCNKACGGACEACAQPGKKGTCMLLASGTTCGATACSGSTLSKKQCDGKSPACQTISSSCAPYKCAAGQAACATSCTAHTQCTTGLCDLFDMHLLKNTCASTTNLCYADVSKNCSGVGTAASPHCTIQACLNKNKPYVSVAPGTYYENLKNTFSTQIVAQGFTGPLLKGGAPGVTTVILKPSKANTPGVLISGYKQVALVGLEITPGSGGSGDLVHARTDGRSVWLRSCHLHNANGGVGLRLEKPSASTAQTVYVEDTAINVNLTGISATESHLKLDGVTLRYNAQVGLKHETQTLTVRDALIQFNGSGGIVTYGSTLDLDRLKVSLNTGVGLQLDNNTTGTVFNLLSADNSKEGIGLYNNTKPPTFVNVTVAQNGATEVSCSTDYTYFYNSVIWDKNNTASYSGKCFFEHSDVRGGAYGTGNIDQDPKFVGSGVDPYTLMSGTVSPCVDAGDDSISGVTLPALDLAKKKRKVNKLPNTAVIDMGAYEVQ